MNSDPIRGSTIRWTYDDGPMAGKAFEHTFKDDGTVTYREAPGANGEVRKPSTNGQGKTAQPKKEPAVKYEVEKVNDEVYAVSYLASSGYTLTSVLDLDSGTVVSFASNEKELVVQRGTFDITERVG